MGSTPIFRTTLRADAGGCSSEAERLVAGQDRGVRFPSTALSIGRSQEAKAAVRKTANRRFDSDRPIFGLRGVPAHSKAS